MAGADANLATEPRRQICIKDLSEPGRRRAGHGEFTPGRAGASGPAELEQAGAGQSAPACSGSAGSPGPARLELAMPCPPSPRLG
jgi:hypothetical protein